MAEFSYKAKNQQGELQEGIIEAFSQERAVEELHKKGLVILGLEKAEKGLFERDIGQYFIRPTGKDLVIFTRQLATLIEADIPLIEGLRTLVRQTSKESFKKIINEITEAVEGGASLSQALSKHKLFSPFFISLVKSGEVAGRMQATLLYLAEHLENNSKLKSQIRGALAYPAFIVTAMFIVGLIMATSVLPKLLVVITETGVEELPVSTKILMFVTNFINDYIFLILGSLAAGTWFLVTWLKTPSGQRKFDMLKIKFPRLGIVARNVYLSRIAETLSTLIKSGVPILEGLKITSEVVRHSYYKKILLEAEKNVRGGGTISEVFGKYKEIPSLFQSMLAVGEKTGKIDVMLENIQKFYKSEADRDIANMSQLIEPILILILGVAVFVIVSAVLLPIYSLVGGS